VGSGSEQEQGNGNPRTHRNGPPTEAELHRRFYHRPPRDEQAKVNHGRVSDNCYLLAVTLCETCPPGRNLSLALTALEDVRMRANAAIAVDDPRP
jgi:hypothetical protein